MTLMDTIQALLIAVVMILTIMLVVIGFQVFYILRELRKTLFKANRVLENTQMITETVREPIASLSTLAAGIRSGSAIVTIIKKLKERISQENGRSLATGRGGKHD